MKIFDESDFQWIRWNRTYISRNLTKSRFDESDFQWNRYMTFNSTELFFARRNKNLDFFQNFRKIPKANKGILIVFIR